MRSLVLSFIGTVMLVLGGCQSSPAPSADAVIDSARAAHGSSTLNQATVTFGFRGDAYRLRLNDGQFHYRRAFTDSLDRSVTEGLTNEGPYRVIEGDTTNLDADGRAAVDTNVNSVAYFTLLPAPLDDPGVQSSYRGRDTIDGAPYHRVQVTFRQEDGGRDWEDVFLYWFHTDTYAMDYFAYAYGLGSEEDTGTRFREAYNHRRRGGVQFADYYNYTADTLAPDQMERYPDLWARDALQEVSRVALDSVQVRPLPSS